MSSSSQISSSSSSSNSSHSSNSSSSVSQSSSVADSALAEYVLQPVSGSSSTIPALQIPSSKNAQSR
ncbi:MAG: hypothetical protein CVU45_04075 [Chloroflexi bacterium HGW-Chloroflexi-7]|nr:MAG: hypothetical protein CVU45_04075 [Chloroflexi bacterium HGW-Chloroflexi-7]HCS39252.1 hypothetical protein [Anaerolineaceae bacterium]